MAVITPTEMDKLRQAYAAGNVVAFEKPDFNAATQAIEDTWEATVRGLLSTAIDNAGAHVFTNAEKKDIGRLWLRHKFGKGG